MENARRGNQLFRRDFLFGAVAGVAGTAGAAMLTPLEWKVKALPDGTKLSFAQDGEDIVCLTMLKQLGVKQPSYLDVGAFLPILGNNTYLMYREGGRGVLIEPNVACIKELKSERPGDTVLNIGVGISGVEETADYYVLNHPQMNTFDADEAHRRETGSNRETVIQEVVKMPLVPINKVIADQFGGKTPDYLSVDVEGMEVAILKSLDFKTYRPKVICVDTLTNGGIKMTTDAADYLATQAYIVRGMTHANTVFLDQKLL